MSKRILTVVLGASVLLVGACSGDRGGQTGQDATAQGGVSYPALSGNLPRPATAEGPVWLVGLDGATWDLIDPMLERGELPHLASLIEDGTRAVMLSEEPTISPSLWATVATGVPREVHGIINFTEKIPGSYDEIEVGPAHRRAPAIWDLVGAAGGRSWVLSWFGSYPAEPISGVYLSKGLDPGAPGPGQVQPPDAENTVVAGASRRVAGFRADRIARTEFLDRTVTDDARTMALLEELSVRDEADFVAVYLAGIDVVQHVTWKHMDPRYEPFPGEGPPLPEMADVIPSYYRYVDRLLGRMIELAPTGTTFVIVSDHGGGAMEPSRAFHFQLDVLLRMLGYARSDPADPGRIDPGRTKALTISELYRDTQRIWLNLEETEARGTVPLEAAPATAREIAERLASLRTDSGEPLFESVDLRLDREPWRPGDPAIEVRFSRAALLARTVVDRGRELDFSPVRLRHSDVSGGHRLEGIFVANGPAVRPGRLERPATLYNVAPTVLYLLGLPQDRRMLRHAPPEGGLLELAVRPEVLEARAPAMVEAYAGADWPVLRADAPSVRDPSRDESLEKLRTLGYLR